MAKRGKKSQEENDAIEFYRRYYYHMTPGGRELGDEPSHSKEFYEKLRKLLPDVELGDEKEFGSADDQFDKAIREALGLGDKDYETALSSKMVDDEIARRQMKSGADYDKEWVDRSREWETRDTKKPKLPPADGQQLGPSVPVPKPAPKQEPGEKPRWTERDDETQLSGDADNTDDRNPAEQEIDDAILDHAKDRDLKDVPQSEHEQLKQELSERGHKPEIVDQRLNALKQIEMRGWSDSANKDGDGGADDDTVFGKSSAKQWYERYHTLWEQWFADNDRAWDDMTKKQIEAQADILADKVNEEFGASAPTARELADYSWEQSNRGDMRGLPDSIWRKAFPPDPRFEKYKQRKGKGHGAELNGGDGQISQISFVPPTSQGLSPEQKVARDLAVKMKDEGKSREEIWQATEAAGMPWYQDRQGKWWGEITDAGAAFKPGAKITEGGSRLGDVLDHEPLYAARPELRDLPVKLDPSIANEAAAEYRWPGGDVKEPHIAVNPNGFAAPGASELDIDELSKNSGGKYGAGDLMSTILHETGHDAQYRAGSRPDEVIPYITEDRAGFSDKERGRIPPWETEDEAIDYRHFLDDTGMPRRPGSSPRKELEDAAPLQPDDAASAPDIENNFRERYHAQQMASAHDFLDEIAPVQQAALSPGVNERRTDPRVKPQQERTKDPFRERELQTPQQPRQPLDNGVMPKPLQMNEGPAPQNAQWSPENTQQDGETVEQFRDRILRAHPELTYEWEGDEATGPTERDIQHMEKYPTDGVLEGFTQQFGFTPNANWKSRQEMMEDMLQIPFEQQPEWLRRGYRGADIGGAEIEQAAYKRKTPDYEPYDPRVHESDRQQWKRERYRDLKQETDPTWTEDGQPPRTRRNDPLWGQAEEYADKLFDQRFRNAFQYWEHEFTRSMPNFRTPDEAFDALKKRMEDANTSPRLLDAFDKWRRKNDEKLQPKDSEGSSLETGDGEVQEAAAKSQTYEEFKQKSKEAIERGRAKRMQPDRNDSSLEAIMGDKKFMDDVRRRMDLIDKSHREGAARDGEAVDEDRIKSRQKEFILRELLSEKATRAFRKKFGRDLTGEEEDMLGESVQRRLRNLGVPAGEEDLVERLLDDHNRKLDTGEDSAPRKISFDEPGGADDAGAKSIMEPNLFEHSLGMNLPENSFITDSGQVVDKDFNPATVTRRPHMLPITKDAEGNWELAWPKLMDILGLVGPLPGGAAAEGATLGSRAIQSKTPANFQRLAAPRLTPEGWEVLRKRNISYDAYEMAFSVLNGAKNDLDSALESMRRFLLPGHTEPSAGSSKLSKFTGEQRASALEAIEGSGTLTRRKMVSEQALSLLELLKAGEQFKTVKQAAGADALIGGGRAARERYEGLSTPEADAMRKARALDENAKTAAKPKKRALKKPDGTMDEGDTGHMKSGYQIYR